MSTIGEVRRRTLPAPSEPFDPDALRAERDHLALENAMLRENLEAMTREARRLSREVEAIRGATTRTALWGEPPTRAAPAATEIEPSAGAPRPVYAGDEIPTGGATDIDRSPNGGIDFGAVSRLTPAELDTLPYGLICLDAQGRVVHYNDTESRLARLPKDRVIGRSFFAEVAPCTRVREFEGQFFELVRDPSRIRVRSFDFVFRFKHSEQHVTIVLTPARVRGLYNMALLRRTVVPR